MCCVMQKRVDFPPSVTFSKYLVKTIKPILNKNAKAVLKL